jgi:hypothetical protein
LRWLFFFVVGPGRVMNLVGDAAKSRSLAALPSFVTASGMTGLWRMDVWRHGLRESRMTGLRQMWRLQSVILRVGYWCKMSGVG